MSWTAPRTWVTDEVVSASQLNTHVRDDMLETAPAKVTTAGDTVYATGANALARLAVGGAGDRLRVDTAGTALEWDAVILDRDLSQQEAVSEAGLYGIWSHSVGANELGATGGLRLTMAGDYLNNTGIDRTLLFTIRFGGDIFSGTMTFPASANRRKWRLVVEGMNSATGAQKWTALWVVSQASTIAFGVTDPTETTDGKAIGYAASTEDTTGAIVMAVLIQHAVSNASLSLRKEIAILEKLPAA